jgi:hypothetical protein
MPDFNQIVNTVANHFPIEEDAREALIIPAQAHSLEVDHALATGALDMEFLRCCIYTVFSNAYALSMKMQLQAVTRPAIETAMSWNCEITFWC